MPPHLLTLPSLAQAAVTNHIARMAKYQIKMGDANALFKSHFDGTAYLRWVENEYAGEVDAEAALR